MKKSIDLPTLKTTLRRVGAAAFTYRVMLFFLVLAGLYGFVLLRINNLSQARPSAAQLDAEVQTKSLKVDDQIVKKIQQLQDNSVNVQALFDQLRDNPFHE